MTTQLGSSNKGDDEDLTDEISDASCTKFTSIVDQDEFEYERSPRLTKEERDSFFAPLP